MTIRSLPVDAISHRADARRRADHDLAALADSIEQIGLINPIRVRETSPGQYEVVAGSHRFQACDALGWTEIPCFVVDDDDLHAELAMIDENLIRAELSASERASQTARRKAIYLELYPQSRHGGDRKSDQVAKSATRSFADATASATGASARTVRQDAERGERVTPEAMEALRGTRLDTGAYLDKLKRTAPAEQVAKVKADLAQPSPAPGRGGISARYAQNETPTKPQPKALDRFIALVDDIEAVAVDDIMAGLERRRRAELAQRASGLADRANEIMERLDQ